MEMLRECWADFDEDGTGFININEFDAFLTKLGSPLGFSQQEQDEIKKNEFLKRLKLPTYKQMKHYYYYDVIKSLT
jgi:Ca2+-binding EF-hand superfamily protein